MISFRVVNRACIIITESFQQWWHLHNISMIAMSTKARTKSSHFIYIVGLHLLSTFLYEQRHLKNLFYCSVLYTQRNINSSEKSTSERWSVPQRYRNRICKYSIEQKLNDSRRKNHENKTNIPENSKI